MEFRAEGKSDIDAILLGLAKTGRVICAAGIIMAIAFFGLLLSSEASMNELSFFLVVRWHQAIILPRFQLKVLLMHMYVLRRWQCCSTHLLYLYS